MLCRQMSSFTTSLLPSPVCTHGIALGQQQYQEASDLQAQGQYGHEAYESSYGQRDSYQSREDYSCGPVQNSSSYYSDATQSYQGQEQYQCNDPYYGGEEQQYYADSQPSFPPPPQPHNQYEDYQQQYGQQQYGQQQYGQQQYDHY